MNPEREISELWRELSELERRIDAQRAESPQPPLEFLIGRCKSLYKGSAGTCSSALWLVAPLDASFPLPGLDSSALTTRERSTNFLPAAAPQNLSSLISVNVLVGLTRFQGQWWIVSSYGTCSAG